MAAPTRCPAAAPPSGSPASSPTRCGSRSRGRRSPRSGRRGGTRWRGPWPASCVRDSSRPGCGGVGVGHDPPARPLTCQSNLRGPTPAGSRLGSARRSRGAPCSRCAAAATAERRWIARLPVTLRNVCLGAWVLAAAGPRLGSARIEARSEGISIVLCVDLSSSMLAEDFAPANRIDVAKATAIDFVRARRSDRIGLVAFAAQALTQVPLTTAYAVLEAARQRLRIGMLEDGTAIGTAIATAANRLRRAPGKSKVIVLLTDGVNNRGTVDPRTAGQAAGAFGIKIYAIGVGRQGEAPVPTGQAPDGTLRYQSMPVEIDEALLTDVARGTGGR